MHNGLGHPEKGLMRRGRGKRGVGTAVWLLSIIIMIKYFY